MSRRKQTRSRLVVRQGLSNLGALLLILVLGPVSCVDNTPSGGPGRDDAGIHDDLGIDQGTEGQDIGKLGGYGDPCESNQDCELGLCVPSMTGYVCTRPCLDDCEGGWSCRATVNSGSDPYFICMPPSDRLCASCTDSKDCEGGLCLRLDPGDQRLYCTQPCTNGVCRQGFTCDELELDGQSYGEHCTPTAGTCTCTPLNSGIDRLCRISNDLGTCLGRETCIPEQGWTGCNAAIPNEEICNQIDDDCNGLADDLPLIGRPCTRELELDGKQLSCAGTYGCMEGTTELQCRAPEPTAEVCNHLDDDCDQEIDEDFPELGRACAAGRGACARYGAVICSDDGTASGCNATPGEPVEELCDGIDNDCDEATDEEFPHLGEPCVEGQGACRAGGTIVCSADGRFTECSVRAGNPSAERCDGLDNDCDGSIDEDFPELYTACVAGAGSCMRPGVKVCGADGRSLRCNAVAGEPGVETCNGLDDDCDGLIDKGHLWANLGSYCVVGQGICAAGGIYVCNPQDPTGATICNAALGQPAVEQCDGMDNDCDGQIDNNLPPAPACANREGVCAGSTKICAGSRGWLPCNSSNYPPTYESNETQCDALDNDCDGLTDEELVGAPCALQNGVCAGSRTFCADGGWAQCGPEVYGPAYEPVERTCDLLDNDCDGETDEGWLHAGKYDEDTACGNCFTNCRTIYDKPHAFGVCDATNAPRCRMTCCRIDSADEACQDAGDYFDFNGIPDDGCEFLLDPQAIYVSIVDPEANDDAGCGHGPVGTQPGYYPCRTIGAGIREAKANGRVRVLVADGLYEELVTLENGISLLGGYRAETWERHVNSTLTILRGLDAELHKRTIHAANITISTAIQGFALYGQNNSNISGNSYVIYAINAPALRVTDNVIYAGAGGPGRDQTPAAAGSEGQNGQGREADPLNYDAREALGDGLCNASNTRQLNNGGVLQCSGDDVGGGAGGGLRCSPIYNSKTSGKDGSPGRGGDGVLGGIGGAFGSGGYDGFLDNICLQPNSPMIPGGGANGTSGGNGSGGLGCRVPAGSVVNLHWQGGSGSSGVGGGNGGGGGGGGSGGGGDCSGKPEACLKDRLGGHGGGGGSGGCGGGGGLGGSAGGGSFGILVVNGTAPVIQNNTILQNEGGNGGDGGNGGSGGSGGHGGDGGLCPGDCKCYLGGGKGGEGGRGGHGGGGGGGCGGPSYGIFTANVQGVFDYCSANQNNSFQGGRGGGNGSGGSSSGAPGGDGLVGALDRCVKR